MKNRTCLIAFIALFCTVSAYAQTTKKTVILYNVVPLNVELLPDGTIKNIYGKAYDRFKGYQLVRKDAFDVDGKDEFANIDNDVIVSTDATRLLFNDQMATLNEATVAKLEKIKNNLFQNPNKKIILTSYTINKNSKTEEILLQNRLASCLSYLEILGVAKSRIVLDTKTQESDLNAILAAEIINSELVNQE